MKYLFTLLFSLTYISTALCQNQTTIYYKNVYKSKKVKEKYAYYSETISIDSNGLNSVTLKNIRKGITVSEKFFINNHPTGIWKDYNKKGILISEKNFNTLIYSEKKIENGNYFNINFSIKNKATLDFTPPFYISKDEFFNYLANNSKYPPEAKNIGLSGKVYIHLKIDQTGDLIPLGIYKGVHPILDLQVFELYQKMPNWTPAYKDGKPIDSYTIMPFNYSLR